MFCGDDTGGVVVDVGAHACKFGYAGDDVPRAIFPGRVGVLADETSSSKGGSRQRIVVGNSARLFRPSMEIKRAVEFGVVEDWDALESIWAHGFSELKCVPAEHPVVIAEPSYGFAAQRERMAELMFEVFNVPAMYLARAPTLGALSIGRASAIVVDLGHDATQVTPVYDGYVINKGTQLSDVGGALLSRVLAEMVASNGGEPDAATVLPRHAISRRPFTKLSAAATAQGTTGAGMDVDDERPPLPTSHTSGAAQYTTTGVPGSSGTGAAVTSNVPRWIVTRRALVGEQPSFRAAMVAEVWDDAKRCLAEVHETGFDASKPPAAMTYELPDGSAIRVRTPRQLVSELLFRPEVTDIYRALLPFSVGPTASAPSATVAALLALNATGDLALRPSPSQPQQPVASASHTPNAAAPWAVPTPLPSMIHNALLAVSPELRRLDATTVPPRLNMVSRPYRHPLPFYRAAVILTGGGSLLKGLQQRLHWEMLALIPTAFKPRIIAPAPVEREFAAWIGGSILASLGTFQQLWVSRAEYDEEGPMAIERRCL